MPYDFINLLNDFSNNAPTKKTTNISNSTIIIGNNNVVNAYNEISALPIEVQETAKELLSILENCLNTKSKPKKNFGKKFGEFINTYASVLPSFCSLALKLLSLIF